MPSGTAYRTAFNRLTHMAVAAHPDDAEIMAFDGIAKHGTSFAAVIVTDGAGAVWGGKNAGCSGRDIKGIRRREQKTAAAVGGYGALVLLDYTSAQVKDPTDRNLGADLDKLLAVCAPRVVYTHNPADKHDTHVAVAVKTLEALRRLPRERHPQKLYGCEVWRGLDWLCDADKAAMDVTGCDELSAKLLGVYESQTAGGKRYDLAVEGRRRANAVFFDGHSADTAEKLIFALDMTPLLSGGDIVDFTLGYIERFKRDVAERLKRYIK